MTKRSDGSWVVILLIVLMIFLFFIPVILDNNFSHQSSTLQWISAVGGILSPLSAIFVSYYVFLDQKTRERSDRILDLKINLHEELKSVYELTQLTVFIDGTYKTKIHSFHDDMDDYIIRRSSSIVDKIDHISIWSNNDNLLVKRSAIISRLNYINTIISRRKSIDRNQFASVNLASLDKAIVSSSDHLFEQIKSYKDLIVQCAKAEGLTDFLRYFVTDSAPPPASAPTPSL